jgi:hypothetical protein
VFARFCDGYGITEEGELFHKFALSRADREFWTQDTLSDMWQEFDTWGRDALLAAADAADLHETQGATVAAGYPA